MSDLSIPVSGLQTSVAQLTASAANIVTAQSGNEPVPVGGSSNHPISIKSSDFTSDLVTQTLALANYRANLAVIRAQDAMDKSTLDLIG